MTTQERRNRVLELVRVQGGFASLPDLAQALRVSESTIRRDLEHLEELGAAKRTRGGVFYTGRSPKLAHFEERQPEQWDKKQAIASRAAELVTPGETLLLDGGTTTYELARLLVGRTLQIVTNSLPVANLFAADPRVELVLIGGNLHSGTGVTLGPYAEQMLARLNVRRTILSVSGISEQGFYNSNSLLVETERAMLAAAEENIVLADSTKFGHHSLAHLCGLGDVQRLVVDEGIPDQWQERVKEAGVDLIVAPALNLTE